MRRHQSLKEMLVKRSRGEWQELWALRDVSFNVQRGEVLGIIGENGSGKSTSLKLLAGILFPDSGTIQTVGRVSSLLELGAGFQAEYSGRENIYLYGALLGLRRREIERQFENIVHFSELGSFIEYPVKNYSSGMYMRLGFAVAVHLDPDILLIDEVLAVGDAHFQKKCFDHLQLLRDSGKTIVLVSHDLESVRRFCERVIWLDHGHVAADGHPDKTIASYLEATSRRFSHDRMSSTEVPGYGQLTGEVEMVSVRLFGERGETRSLTSDERLTIEIKYHADRSVRSPAVVVNVFRNDGLHCTEANSELDSFEADLNAGDGVIYLTFPRIGLNAGTYDMSIAILDPISKRMHDFHERRHPFTVRGGNALVSLDHRWEVLTAAPVTGHSE
jgi:ABC-2 type transport system ATP-binding protein